GLLERAAGRLRLAHVRQLEARRRRKPQSPALRKEPGGVAHGGHLNAGLGAVDETVAHFWVDRIAVGDGEGFVEKILQRAGCGAGGSAGAGGRGGRWRGGGGPSGAARK